MNKAADVHQHPWQKTLRANQELWKTMDQPRGPWQTTTTSHRSWLFCPFSLLKSVGDNRHPQASQMNKSCGNTPWQTPGSAKVLALSWVHSCPLFGLYNWPSHLKFKFALGLTVQGEYRKSEWTKWMLNQSVHWSFIFCKYFDLLFTGDGF